MKRVKVSLCFITFWFFPVLLSADDGYIRNTKIDVIHYRFSVLLNDSTDRIEGNSRITVRFLGIPDSVAFDLAAVDTEGKGMLVTNVTILEKPLRWIHHDQKLTVFTPNIDTGIVEIEISYKGTPADGLIISENKYGKRVFFSDHWPDRAHDYLPCIDHPYDKAPVDFYITAPEHYKIVANGVFSGEWPISGGYKCTHWSETVPLPVKVMAFGAADFSVLDTARVNDIQVSSWVFPENEIEGFSDYSIAVKPLQFYIRTIGSYPYRKLANVQSKTIYGGLENAGTIFYAERSVTGKGRAEGLIAHEIAHQWFGNNVTEDDWHHVWLSEGFATYLTSMYFEETRGRQALVTDMDSTRARIIRYYRKNNKPVIDTTVTDLMKLLNTNTYQKGAWVLHMLRNEIGDEAFITGLRLFFARYRNSNVLTGDFVSVIEEVSGKKLQDFFRQWLWRGGHPQLKITAEDKRISIEQIQTDLFQFPIDFRVSTSGGEKNIRVNVTERSTEVHLPGKIISFEPDPDVILLFERK